MTPVVSTRRDLLPAMLLAACAVYATFRYVVFSDVSAEQLPVYVFNKGVSLAGLILLALSRCQANADSRRRRGLAGLVFIGTHVLLSVAILQPPYFAKFYYPSGRMTWQAESSMLAGVVGIVLLALLFFSTCESSPARPYRAGSLVPWLGRGVLAVAALHVGLMGYSGWWDTSKWPGRLPPITLLSFLVALVGLACPRQAESPE